MSQCASVTINASPEEVWDVLVDLRNADKFINGVTKVEVLTDGDIREGTVWKETRKIMGQEATEEMTIKSLDKPKSMSVSAFSCGTAYTSGFSLKKVEQETELSFHHSGEPKTWFAWFFSWIGFLFAGQLNAMMQEDLECIRKEVEARKAKGVK